MRSILSYIFVILLGAGIYPSVGSSRPAGGLIPVHADGGETGTSPFKQRSLPHRKADLTDIVDDTTTIGTTWWDSHTAGSVGYTLAKSVDDYLYFTWTNGLNEGAIARHVYYNLIDPEGNQGWLNGYPVSEFIGSPGIDVRSDGRAVISGHCYASPTSNYSVVAVDFLPHSGSFLTTAIPNPPDIEILWPRIQLDTDDFISVVGKTMAGLPYYTRGTYDPPNYTFTWPPSPTWTVISDHEANATEVATSPVSEKVAVVWTEPTDEGTGAPWDHDLWLLIDEDGADLNFDEGFNLTHFIPPDISWLPDTLIANQDTHRVYIDVNLFIDQDDWVHAAFTTRSFFALQGITYWHASLIWHWSEQFCIFPGNPYDDFHLIHNAWDDNSVNCGAWNVKAQRPSLGQDSETGYLYCVYQVYDCDTTHLSAAGYPSGDIYISASTDGGMSWSVGTNITETITTQSAPVGECLSEISPSIAKIVDGECHTMYILDRDAGCVLQNEGTFTDNSVYYHKVPTELIPTEPHVPQDVPFHVFWDAVEPEIIPGSLKFIMHEAYPNPFNPTTTISFDLSMSSFLNLNIYDIQGNVVASLINAKWNSGSHKLIWDATGMASGLYLCRIQVEDFTTTEKLILMK